MRRPDEELEEREEAVEDRQSSTSTSSSPVVAWEILADNGFNVQIPRTIFDDYQAARWNEELPQSFMIRTVRGPSRRMRSRVPPGTNYERIVVMEGCNGLLRNGYDDSDKDQCANEFIDALVCI